MSGLVTKVKSASLLPQRKVTAGLIVGAPVAIVLSWAWNEFVPAHPLPDYVATALGSLITTGVAWLTAPKENENRVVVEPRR